ncbi:TPA: peptidoglycan DD-metalloendopeptidase family protein [Photobacterium damselae]
MLGTTVARLPRMHKILIATVAIGMVIVGLWPTPSTESYSAKTNKEAKYKVGQHYPLYIAITDNDDRPTTNLKNQLDWRYHTIRRGETLAIAFDKMGLSSQELHRLLQDDKGAKQLTELTPGDTLEFGFEPSGQLTHITLKQSPIKTLVVEKQDDGQFESRIEQKAVDTHTNFAQATISSSFWSAADKAGLTANQIMEIAGIFGWDIDFALDIRAGDKFAVLYEEHFVDGERIDRGNILAATFTNMGQTFTAVRSKDGSYYSQDGEAMRKAFLRSPINFRYVSSNFNPRRLHPVTGKVKAHRGTDYVAPIGTPIWSAGDGIVMESSYNRFNGNYVFVRHSSKYVTKYLHMTKRSVKKGQRVKQGQVVGTLGGTGRVTGPHLHYEFLVNGVHKNPRTVQLPQAEALHGKKKAEFKQMANKRMEQISLLKTLYAYN